MPNGRLLFYYPAKFNHLQETYHQGVGNAGTFLAAAIRLPLLFYEDHFEEL
jgi:hypothetical protein